MIFTSIIRILLTRSFKPFVFKGKGNDKLDFEALNNMGLYVHIPFCSSICNFCPYNKEIFDNDKAKDFKIAIFSEIDLVCGHLTVKKKVTSLYFGGGTPALMTESIGEIILKLKEYFIISGGIGLELHPDNVTPMILEILKNAGVTMVSIGIQTFDLNCLKIIGRKYNSFKEKIQLVKSFGFSVIDVDLIFALPGQTPKSLFYDIKTAFECGATQVSAYPFIDFTFVSKNYKPQSAKVKRQMLQQLVDVIKQLNLERTSVWTFSQKGFGKYSSVTRENFLGFGPSATTLLKDSFKVNTFSVDEYINAIKGKKVPTALTLDFTPRQRAVYFLFWSAYWLFVNVQNFQNIVGKPLDSMFGFEIRLLQHFGFIIKVENGYKLTDKAGYFYHKTEQAYTTAYINKMWNTARVEPFPKKIVLW